MNLTEKKYAVARVEKIVRKKIDKLHKFDDKLFKDCTKEINNVVTSALKKCNGSLVLPKTKNTDILNSIEPVYMLPIKDLNKCLTDIRKIRDRYGITGYISKKDLFSYDSHKAFIDLTEYKNCYHGAYLVNFAIKTNFDKANEINNLLKDLVDNIYIGDAQKALDSIKIMENFKI